MGRHRKYTAQQLEEAVEHYFASITRERTVTELRETGERDGNGHKIREEVPVCNSLGQPVTETEYILPPTVADLCLALGIDSSTWESYCKDEKYHGTTTRAQGRMRAWNMRQLLTRSGKDVRGIIFNLENNYGMRSRTEVELGPKAAAATAAPAMSMDEREALLKQIARDFGEVSSDAEPAEQS